MLPVQLLVKVNILRFLFEIVLFYILCRVLNLALIFISECNVVLTSIKTKTNYLISVNATY